MSKGLAVDHTLLNEAMAIKKSATQGEVINLALREFVDRHRQRRILELEGKMDFREDWDYKKDRKSRAHSG